VVLVFNDGVVYDKPLETMLPPLEVAYQFTVFDDVTEIVTVPGPHLVLSIATGALGVELISACTATRGLLHPELEASA
jgi:hypothetical protein